MISLKKVLLSGAAIAALTFSLPAIAADHGAAHHDEMPADQGAPDDHAEAPVEDHPMLQMEEEHELSVEEHHAPSGDTTLMVTETTTTTTTAATPPAARHHEVAGKNLCQSGHMQSPINIAEYMPESLAKLKIAYAPTKLAVVNNGDAIGVRYEPGSKFMSADKVYDLLGFSFHSPSEHYVNGAPYPVEMQLMHRAEDGGMAALGVMMKLGAANPAIQKILDNVPTSGGETVRADVMLDMVELLPSQGNYYVYDGSLTMPPCTEGVKWHVLKQPIELSLDQLHAFQMLYPMNARSVQPLNGRIVSGSQSGS